MYQRENASSGLKTLSCSTSSQSSPLSNGFTIVELLVVIVVIGILAAITIVSYTGISQRAKEASLKSDLDNSSKLIKLFQVTEASGNYPTANNCPTPGATEICLKPSDSNSFGYTVSNVLNPKTFILYATNGTTVYHITNDSTPVVTSASLAVSDPTNWLAIGTQVWAKANLNVGTMVTGATTQQLNNSTLEKYCYGDLESNCTTYGALYQWNEAMQYVATEGSQGICPTGSHIPSDNDWKILEMQLGMTQTQADAVGWRGTDQGTRLKPSGTSGLNVPLAGNRDPIGSFYNLSSYGYLWVSLEVDASVARARALSSAYATVFRGTGDKGNGFPVRCMGN